MQSDATYSAAREHYGERGIDTDAALTQLATIPLSLQCWQGDDVGGFEPSSAPLGGGLQVTGNHPGKARSVSELRRDLEQAMALIPSQRLRVNLHAMYGEFPSTPPFRRDQVAPEHFSGWMDWAADQRTALDFNATCFSHPLAAEGFTLSHRDPNVRGFWIDHVRSCRRIAAAMGRRQGSPAVTNLWIPDGFKDTPADRVAPRARLAAALDEVFREALNPRHLLDAVESKLFGLGSESYVVGSHEFYLGYAITRKKLLCLDLGHFHPTESVADKISALHPYVPGLLLHVSRGVRWDSDHVVLFDDATRSVFEEVIAGDFLGRTHLGLDYFDGSINRIAAWVIGARNTLKCILAALLRPNAALAEREAEGDYTSRLAIMEEAKTLPLGAVWSEYCRRLDAPDDWQWLHVVKRYEMEILAGRGGR